MFPLPKDNTETYIVYDVNRETRLDNCIQFEAAIKKKLKKKTVLPLKTIYSGFGEYSFKHLSVTSFRVGDYCFIEHTIHNENPNAKIEGVVFTSYYEASGKIDKMFFERVSCDAKGNFRLHILFEPSDSAYKLLRLHFNRIIPSYSILEKTTSRINQNAQKIISLVSTLKNIPDIDIEPITDNDFAVFVPLDCSYSKKFFSKIFLLQNHYVHYHIISQFGLQQYQVPIKADNQELLLLVCGEHCLSDTVSVPTSEIGISAIPRETDYLNEYSEILKLISETRKIALDYEKGLLVSSDVYSLYQQSIDYLKEWIKKNTDLAYKQYVDKSSEIIKWKSEYRLYQLMKLFFTDAVFQFRTEWLEEQSLDIYIPSLFTAIEYQGKQHYEVVDYFGGREKFEENKERDIRKRHKCEQNGIRVLDWNYKITVTYRNVQSFIIEHFPGADTSIQLIENNLEIGLPFRISDLLNTKQRHQTPKTHILNNKAREDFCIIKYGEDGVFLNKYSTIEEASQDVAVSVLQIRKAIYGYASTAGGYQWRKVSQEDVIQNIDPIIRSYNSDPIAIIQINSCGVVVGEYPSIRSAVKNTGINSKSIRDALKGRQKTAGGYSWIYAEQ